jgi:hypothetical protein
MRGEADAGIATVERRAFPRRDRHGSRRAGLALHFG